MALSPDFDLDMRRSVISETPPAFPSSGVIFVDDPTLTQARDLGIFSGVEITPQEAALYKNLREKPLNATELIKSDQEIMADDVLTGEKSAQFKKAFANIFSPLH